MRHGVGYDIGAQGEGKLGFGDIDIGSLTLVPGASNGAGTVNNTFKPIVIDSIKGQNLPKTLFRIRRDVRTETIWILVDGMIVRNKGECFVREDGFQFPLDSLFKGFPVATVADEKESAALEIFL